MTSATPSYVLQDAFAFEDMRRHAAEAFGCLGGEIADAWRKFNTAYFNDALKSIPLVISQTLPFGKRCSHNLGHYRSGRAITLNLPVCGDHLIGDNGTLLHEMTHQCMFERGEDSAHAGEPGVEKSCALRISSRAR